ncbi:MAG: hypothetical protein LBF40_01400 [Deltaproteobacteria bacterium]|jgi:tRNA nucleotidyltransferase/poly(A) polymerase|nr:hypothetical protein [Deltaproteobacteria bacterium]
MSERIWQLNDLAGRIKKEGGRLLVVGGAVRDRALSRMGAFIPRDSDDLDLVVFGLRLEKVARILKAWGRPRVVTRKATSADKPETRFLWMRMKSLILEISVVEGHIPKSSGFPGKLLKRDALARDFTANSLYMDPLDGKLMDPLGGLKDLSARRLKTASPMSFSTDPLRILRAFSLVSRRGLVPHPELLSLAASAVPLLKNVAKARIWSEWRSWSYSRFPHLGLRFLRESGALAHFPELHGMLSLPQSWSFHPEGSVWNHTVLVVQSMAELPLPRIPGHSFDRGMLVMSALCHDMGKTKGSLVEDPPTGRAFYPNHAALGEPIVRSFLGSLLCPEHVVRPVTKLARWHMEGSFSTLRASDLRKVARYLAPEATLADLWAIKSADWDGRLFWPERYPVTLEDFLEPVRGLIGPPEDPLSGDEIMRIFGVGKGPALGRLVALVRDGLDRGEISTKEDAIRLIGKSLDEGSIGEGHGRAMP